jgi:hypothetical protein
MFAARMRKQSGDCSALLLPELRVFLVCLQARSVRGDGAQDAVEGEGVVSEASLAHAQ